MCKSGKCKSGKGCLCIIKNLKLKCFVKIEVAARNFSLLNYVYTSQFLSQPSFTH